MLRIFLTLLICTVVGGTALGQGLNTSSAPGRAAFFKYTVPGDVAVTVNIWGTIRHPGRYELKRGSDLADAVSLAGGPEERGIAIGVTQRAITITLSRQSLSRREIVFQSELSSIIESDDVLPTLVDGDVIYINTITEQQPNFQNLFLPALNLVATSLLIVLRIVDLGK